MKWYMAVIYSIAIAGGSGLIIWMIVDTYDRQWRSMRMRASASRRLENIVRVVLIFLIILAAAIVLQVIISSVGHAEPKEIRHVTYCMTAI